MAKKAALLFVELSDFDVSGMLVCGDFQKDIFMGSSECGGKTSVPVCDRQDPQ